MFVTLYRLACMYLAPLFLVTTIGFMASSVYRGEVILGLQAEIIKDRSQEVKVVIEKVEAVNKVGEGYASTQTNIVTDQKETIREVSKIIKVPVFTNICISDDGVLKYNETISKYTPQANPTSEPESGM